MRFKNVFCTQLYKDTFSKVLKEDEFTHGDEILVDMEEPDGDRISYIIMHHGHSISDCKAFVTTTDENVLIAVFDLWGKFYKCYIIKNDSIKNVEAENVLGGKEIKFDGESQYGKISVKMAAVNRQFGTDLKFQREHLQLFAANLQRISENPKCFIQDKDQVNSNNNIDSDEISIDLSLVELTDTQRISFLPSSIKNCWYLVNVSRFILSQMSGMEFSSRNRLNLLILDRYWILELSTISFSSTICFMMKVAGFSVFFFIVSL